jgi:uncharacterized RDD family membrane protein YckC
VVAALLCLTAVAQTTRPAPATPRAFRATGDTARLYLFRSSADESRLLVHRRVGGARLEAGLTGRIADAAPVSDGVAAFLSTGEFWMWRDGAWQRAADLPVRGRPHAMTVDADGVVYALVDGRQVKGLPRFDPDLRPDAWPPGQDLASDQVVLVRYDAKRWSVVAACAPGVRVEPARAALLAVGDAILMARVAESGQAVIERCEMNERAWRGAVTIGGGGAIRRLGAAMLGGIPTFVIQSDGADRVRVFRWLNALRWPEAPDVRPAEIEFSQPPEGGAGIRDLQQVLTYNQHLGLLCSKDGATHISFGRIGGPPLEETIDLNRAFDRLNEEAAWHQLGQWMLLVLMIGVLAAMFLLRPSGLMRTITLPDGMRTALALQRLAAAAIDFLPFAFLWALVIQVNVSEATSVLVQWRFAGETPARDALIWWVASVTSYALYGAVMEALTGRTIGKLALGLSVTNERGGRASPLQCGVRNFVRLVELAPPFWIVALLIVLTPNRQRLGDLFARTLVTRKGPSLMDSGGVSDREVDTFESTQRAEERGEESSEDGDNARSEAHEPTEAPGENVGVAPPGEERKREE